MATLFANSGDPDQTPHSVMSDLGLHCLPITLLGVSNGFKCQAKLWQTTVYSFIIIIFGRKSLDISLELSASQSIYMKYLAYFL